MPIVLRAESPTDGQLQVEAPRHASTQPITNTECCGKFVERPLPHPPTEHQEFRPAGVSARRLSDGDEGSKESSTPSQLVEECEAVETHLGLALNEESSPAEDLAAAEQVAKIAFELYQESHAFEQQLLESQRAGQRSVFPLGSSPAISGIDHQHQHMQGAVNMAAPEYGYGGPLHLTSDLAAPHSQPGGLPPEPFATSPQAFAGVSRPCFSGTQLYSAAHLHFGWIPEPFATSPQAFGGVSRPCFSGTQLYSAAHLHFGWTPQAAFASLHPDSAASQSAAVLPPVAAPFPVGLPSQAAWLLPQGGAQRNPRKRTYSEGPEEAYPGLEPESWLDNVPVIDGSQEVQRQGQAVSLNFPSSDQAAPCSYAACQFSAGAESSGDASRSTSTTSPGGAGEASTATSAEDGAGGVSAAAGAAEPAAAGFQPSWVFRHPFVHSPVLQEGVVAPLIRLSPSNFQESKGSTVRGILAAIRCLFMMQTLDYMDALVLVEHVQELAMLSYLQCTS
ncbi:uncharacterized protein EMH_0088420 [Eimeria mitis]|uniref:Uncharacterized protein n=1 Tax=Eimeria mitis TaxID=44415 RepID=U6KD55_9EIME|nr:uncharacterized protein EMH_0088420 [Eimeria mitis]CDJ34187.1 hypothetical protein EMH_0088420 [Eimeria mitis]